jgi:hypothetical protein
MRSLAYSLLPTRLRLSCSCVRACITQGRPSRLGRTDFPGTFVLFIHFHGAPRGSTRRHSPPPCLRGCHVRARESERRSVYHVRLVLSPKPWTRSTPILFFLSFFFCSFFFFFFLLSHTFSCPFLRHSSSYLSLTHTRSFFLALGPPPPPILPPPPPPRSPRPTPRSPQQLPSPLPLALAFPIRPSRSHIRSSANFWSNVSLLVF